MADSLPLGIGLGGYLIAMATIRWATRAGDWVVVTRFGAAAAILTLALLAAGLGPLVFVTLTATLFLGEAIVEMRAAPPDRGGPRYPLPFQTKPASP